jgi:hypothetical protein
MTKEDYVKLFTDAIKKSDSAIVFKIENRVSDIEDDHIYFLFDYQIDDRKRKIDEDVKLNMKKILGDKYGVSVDRVDAFPNGYAAYTVVIDS